MTNTSKCLKIQQQNPVGAGRYDIQKLEEAQYRNGHTSAFKSKTQKPDGSRDKFLK